MPVVSLPPTKQTMRVKRAWEAQHKEGWAKLNPEPIILTWIRKHKLAMGREVVDIGCGSGRYLVPLIKMGFDVTGIELTDTALKQLKGRLQSEGLTAKVLQGNFRRMRFNTPRFDTALAIQSLQFGDWSTVKRSFSCISRALKPNGLFILRVRSMKTVPSNVAFANERHDLPEPLRGVTYNQTYKTGHSVMVHHYSRGELDFLASVNGFDIVEGPIDRTSRKKMSGTRRVTGQWNAVFLKVSK